MSIVDRPRTRRQTPVMVAFALLVVIVAVAICIAAPFLDWLDPNRQALLESRRPPDSEHWLGTDELGRDILSRVIHGMSATLVGPIVVALSAAVVYVPTALLAASRGGVVDAVVVRVADTILALPPILVIVVVAGLFSGSYQLAVGVLVFLIMPGGLRVVRSVALGQQRLPYLEAARLIGTSERRIMFVHVLPNLLPTIVATVLLDFVTALVALSSLAYLGLGAPPGSADWGSMLSENIRLIDTNPSAAVAPAVLLVVVAFSATTVGDWAYTRLSGVTR